MPPTGAHTHKEKTKSDSLAAALQSAAAEESATTPATIEPPPPPPHTLQFKLDIVEAHGLFTVDDRDDPNAKKKAGVKPGSSSGGTATGNGNSTGNDPPKSSAGKGASVKKKKTTGAEEDHPFHCFITYTPFEPVLIETPLPPPTAEGKGPAKEKKHRAGEEEQPPGPQYMHSLQTEVSEDSTEPKFNYSHTQFVQNKEFFLDTVHLQPLTLHVYQYFPLEVGKKKKTASGGKDAHAASPSTGGASSNSRKKRGKHGEEEEQKPFGELDPDCVAKLGEVRLNLQPFLRGSTQVQGWFPVHMADETLATARGIATSRGKVSLGSPEVFINASVDRVLVDDDERDGANLVTLTIDRVERVPNWILDQAQMEAIENIKRQMAEQEASRPTTGATTTGKDGVDKLSLPSPTHGSPTTPRKNRKDRESNPLDDFPEKDYTDSFTFVYNMPLSSDPRLQRTIRPAAPVPVLGMDELSRSELPITGPWGVTKREIQPEEILPMTGKKPGKTSGGGSSGSDATPAKKKSTAAASSGRSSPHHPLGDDSQSLQTQDPLPFHPSIPRAALQVGHQRTGYLSSQAMQSFKRSIEQGQPWPIALEHVRVPLDEKLAESGKIVQHALILADLRPFLKPGSIKIEAYFPVHQTSLPLPARPVEEKKKRGGASASSGAGKRGTGNVTSPLSGPSGSPTDGTTGGEPAPPTPPETFDEAHTFARVTITLAKPLVPRKEPLQIRDVLPGGEHTNLSSIGASLLQAPRKIERSTATTAVSQAHVLTPQQKVNIALNKFRGLVKDMLERMVQEWEQLNPSGDEDQYDDGEARANLVPVPERTTAARAKQGIPSPASSTPKLTEVLNKSSLSLHFLRSLRPRLNELIESLFSSSLASGTPIESHSRNELFNLLSEECARLLKETIQVRRRVEETNLQRSAREWLERRKEYDSQGKLASYAELHGDVVLANLHHQSRLVNLLTLWQENHHAFPLDSAFDPKDLVEAWYEYGSFLLRRQNAPADLVSVGGDSGSESIQDVFRVLSKTGTIDPARSVSQTGESNVAIDLAEECFKQCLSCNPHHVPSLLCMHLLLLEQNEVDASLEYIHRCISLLPNQAILLAVQGLYHELAEEDIESAGAYHRASVVLHELLNLQGPQASGTDALMSHMLGGSSGHGGFLSLPIFHSQSIHLMLARFLSYLGFRRLTKIVLDRQVKEMDQRLTLEEREQELLAQKDSNELNQGDETNFHISRNDYFQFGPYLELAAWYSVNPECFQSHTLPMLRKASSIIGNKNVEQHHSHSLLYAFALQGNIFYANKKYDEAAGNYRAYLSLMEERNMNIFLDPVVFCNAASLYLLKHILSESLNLATLLVTHPVHTQDPFLWCLFGSVLSAQGKYSLADEALSEAISKDVQSSRGWALYATNQLRRLQSAHHVLNRSTHGRAHAPSAEEFEEARHAFERALDAPAPCQDARILVELARLWFKHGQTGETERSYTRALLVQDDETIRTKLQWLLQQKAGQQPERETKAAVTVQSAMRKAIAKKQVAKKKREQQLSAAKEETEEKEQEF